MSNLPHDVHYAGPILSGLRMLCQERGAQTRNGYLTAGELEQIVNRPGFVGGSRTCEGWRVWQHHGSTALS